MLSASFFISVYADNGASGGISVFLNEERMRFCPKESGSEKSRWGKRHTPPLLLCLRSISFILWNRHEVAALFGIAVNRAVRYESVLWHGVFFVKICYNISGSEVLDFLEEGYDRIFRFITFESECRRVEFG